MFKPATTEVFDYVPQRSDQDAGKQKASFKLFDYPSGSVTYIIDGKSTTDKKYVKKVLDQNTDPLNRISINGPDANGKQIIRLFFIPNEKE